MSAAPENRTAAEASNVLDTLAALSVELACHCDRPPDELVLGAGKLKEACATIDKAVDALRAIISRAEARDGPLLPKPPRARGGGRSERS